MLGLNKNQRFKKAIEIIIIVQAISSKVINFES